MARGCYVLRAASNGKWVVRSGTGYRAAAGSTSTAEKFHFQATDLGTYLLWDSQRRFLTSTNGAATLHDRAGYGRGVEGPELSRQGPVHVLSLTGKPLGVNSQGVLGTSSPTPTT